MSAIPNPIADPALTKALALIAAHRKARQLPAGAAPIPPAEKPPPNRAASLAEIGLGPGMRIRLGQLGLHSVGDLADADAVRLRTALGDISRLIDVEAWINSARTIARTLSAGR